MEALHRHHPDRQARADGLNFASLQAVFTNMIQGVILGEITDINAAVTEAAEGIKAIQ